MSMILRVSMLSCCFCVFVAQASSLLPITSPQHIQRSAAVFRGTVQETRSFQDPGNGHLYTRAVVRVDEVFKGRLPAQVQLIHRGGTLNGRGETDGFAPRFQAGEQRLFLVSRRANGTLYASRGQASALLLAAAPTATATTLSPQFAPGQNLLQELRAQTVTGPLPGSDLSDQATSTQLLSVPGAPATAYSPLSSPASTATNLLAGSDGIPARSISPDRAEPIPYWIDLDYLPAGITQSQAVYAVQTALAAWTNVTSLRYAFAGIQSFGQAAAEVNSNDGSLRIQLHDYYNYLGSDPGLLGIGGNAWIYSTTSAGWTTGGRVGGNDFHKTTRGYVVLRHDSATMQNLSTLTEVLTHEIGHTIGLAHSSEDPSESNPLLTQAIMYYLAHADGRGAALNAYDINVIRQIHPPGNTPPYACDRFLDIVTGPTGPLNIAGVNTLQLRGYDLQTTNLTFAITDASTNNGTFSLVNSNLTYVPKGSFGDSGRLDPASSRYYDIIYARCSDGVNASPYISIKVLSFSVDSYSEGIPNTWRLTYFGNANPSAGLKHHATDDADSDGFSNLVEYRLGSNPTNKTSNLRFTSEAATAFQWQAKAYEVYELYTSTNLISWTRAASPLVPTNSPGTFTGFTNYGPKQYFRIVKVP